MGFDQILEIGFFGYAVMAIVVTIAAFLQGVGGVGFAMLAAPIAVVLVPEMVPGPLLFLGGSVSLLAALRERSEIVVPVVSSALVGRLIGAVIAALGMAQLPKDTLGLLFGIFILSAVLLSALGLRVRPTISNVLGLGTVSGIMGTLTSVGAPALAIAMQSLEPRQLRPSLGMTLFVGSIISIISLIFAGFFTWQDFWLGVILWPFMFFGFKVSNKARSKVSTKNIRRFLLSFCGLSSVLLIVKSIA